MGIIRDILSTKHNVHLPAHYALAVAMMEAVPQEELKQLLPELVELASWYNGVITFVQNLILSLPREWVLEHIEECTAPYLTKETEEEWGVFLGLYELLDKDLYEKLHTAARLHPNPEVRLMTEKCTPSST